ncbi:MAG: hypothetical protein ACOC7L_01890 [Acidobacteriota bacterium]
MVRELAAAGWIALATVALPATAEEANEAEDEGVEEVREDPDSRELRIGRSTLELYGFARLDVIYDDSRPDALQTPTFIESEDPAVSTGGGDSVTIHPRLSRLGAELEGPALDALGGARPAAKLEVDFQNGGRESRAVPRYRHAYLALRWDRARLLAGQTWDLISPLFPTVNSDTLMWNAGNLGDRRAQIRWTYDPPGAGASFATALGLTGAVDDQDLDADGVLDGEEAGVPNLQARLGWTRPVGSGELSLGVWGHVAREELTAPVGGETELEGSSLGVDFTVPVGPRLTLRGEAWSGENLSDVRGGIGQGVNVTTGEEIASQGGWAELAWRATDVYSLYGGATLDAPDEEDLAPGDRKENRAWYLVQRLDLDGAFRVGLDYIHWTTEFVGLDEGTDNRLNLYLIYFF